MPRRIMSFPVRYKTPKRQKTIETLVGKVCIYVSGKGYYGQIVGWNVQAELHDGTIIFQQFHNGKGFNNPFDICEALRGSSSPSHNNILPHGTHLTTSSNCCKHLWCDRYTTTS